MFTSGETPTANRANQYENQILLVLTLIIGAVVGLVVVAFIVLTENLGSKLYPGGGAAWRRVVIPVAGSLVTGFLLSRYFPNARGSGIPQTKVALFLRDGYISFRTVLGKFGLCSVGLASGIALGREGPSVHVGAGIASVLGRRLGLSSSSVRALLPAGAAAALAAAFNTPIAAVLFTLEEVMGDMHAPVLGSIVLSSATSWIVLHLMLGDEPLFHVPPYQLVHPVEFVFYGVLGVAGGIVSSAFVKLLLWQRKRFQQLPRSTGWLQPVAGGLTVGLLGWFFPDVLGVGYGFVGHALNGETAIRVMALLVCLKLVATATCYASGNAGGIFGPSLFMGAMMGGTVGGVAHMLMPDYTASVGAYALVGMGAVFAGVIRVPLTSAIMIFEITRDYSIVVPLMIANLISYFLSSRLQEEPIYEALQHQDGIHLPTGARAREALLTVGHALEPSPEALAATGRISQAAALADRGRGAWPVVDAGGRLRGMVTAEQLDEAMKTGRGEESLEQLVPDPGPNETLTGARFPHVHADQPLDAALRRLATSGLAVLPVVSRTNVRELKGTVSVAGIMAAYAVARGHAPGEPAAVSTRKPARLFAGVIAALIGVALLSAFLNYFYRAERTSRAERYRRAGNELVQKGRYEEASEQYRDALSITHSVKDRLALGMALAGAGRGNEAAIYFEEALRANPASGPANLGLARAYAQTGRIDAAVPCYQRAIYGSRPELPERDRFQARMELIELLAKADRKEQAQAELMAAAAAVPGDPALRKQVGRMLIDRGLAKNAADLFRGMLGQNSRDAGAYDGLGDAQFSLGQYAAAAGAYREALRIDPADQAAGKQADLCDRILALDPTLRGLSAAERLRRSRDVVSAVAGELSACTGGAPADGTAPGRDTELNLAAAERLWQQRLKACPAVPAPDDPLSRVMARYATSEVR